MGWQATATLDNVQNMITYAKRAVALWLEFAKAKESAVTTPSQAEDLLRHDRALYGFAWRDPDNEVIMMVALLSWQCHHSQHAFLCCMSLY